MHELSSRSTLKRRRPELADDLKAQRAAGVLRAAFGTGPHVSAHTATGPAIELHAAGIVPPEWVHLVPAGTFTGVDGRGPYQLDDPIGVIARSMADGPVPIDENHATDLARGHSARAQGWIVAMEARADGVWGKVEWTEAGRARFSERAYRGLSPVLAHDDETSPIVRRILRAALVNDPNLPLRRFA